MSWNLKKRIPILLALLFSVSSCNILSSGSGQPPEPVSSTYEYWVTGGFAGSVEHTVFDSTGLAQLVYLNAPDAVPAVYTYRLTTGEFDTLRSAFESADFFSLDSDYAASQKIADGFNFEIAWNSDAGSKSVRVEANAATPSKLSDLLNVLNETTDVIESKGQKS